MFLHLCFEQIQHWKIAFCCNFFEDALVRLSTGGIVMEIVSAIANVKNSVLAITDRLVHMEIKTDGAH